MKKARPKPKRPASQSAGRHQVSVSLYDADIAIMDAIAADMTEPGGKPASASDVIRDAIRGRAALIGSGGTAATSTKEPQS